MSVYIEFVIVDNYLITYLISKLTILTLKISVAKRRLHLACLLGTLGAICYPFVESTIFVVMFKIILWLLMSVVLFFKKPRFFLGAFTFLAITAMVAGVILMLSLAVEGSVKYEYYFIINEVPVGIIVFTALILLGVAKKIILKVNRYRDLRSLEYYAEFEYCGVLGRLRCFLDTGNRLYDERNGLPIIVVSANKFFATISLEGLNTYLKEGREMFYSAVCGKSKMTLIKPDFFRLYSSRGENILIDVMIGIVFGKLNGEHDAILPLSVIN